MKGLANTVRYHNVEEQIKKYATVLLTLPVFLFKISSLSTAWSLASLTRRSSLGIPTRPTVAIPWSLVSNPEAVIREGRAVDVEIEMAEDVGGKRPREARC